MITAMLRKESLGVLFGKHTMKVDRPLNFTFPNYFQVYYTAKPARPYWEENIGKCLHNVSIANIFLSKTQRC